MKKLLSILLSAAMLASLLTVPAFAEYKDADYDAEIFSQTFDDGTVDGMDGTKAKQITTTEATGERVMELADGAAFQNGFYLSFDFRFDNEDGWIEIHKRKSKAGGWDKLGPHFVYDGGNLKNQTGSSSYDTVGSISVNTWYKAELEGKMVVSDAVVTMTVTDSEGNAVIPEKTISLRNFYAGSSNGVPDSLCGYNVSIDNVKMIAEYPDEIVIATDKDEITASESLQLSYSMKRLGIDETKYDIVWSLYNEDNTEELESEDIYVTSEGVLRTALSEDDTVITVRATAALGDKELIGTKKITIKGASAANELFDEITITGPESLKAGETAEYTFTATKNGEDVTDTLTADKFNWVVYDVDNLNPNNNKSISLTPDGNKAVLKVDNSVIAQKINVRVDSATKLVSGALAVDIGWAESQKEDVLAYNACETAIDTATRVESIDGSMAYQTTKNTLISLPSQRSDYVLTEFDIRFANDNSGVYFERNTAGGGKWNTSFYMRSGVVQAQTGSSSWSSIGSVSGTADDWFHFEVIYRGDSNGNGDASCIVTKYNEDGTLGTAQKVLGIPRRNGDEYGCFDISAGVIIDNIKISLAAANELELVAPREEMFAGENVQFTANIARNGLTMSSSEGITWTVLDEGDLPIIGDDALIKISDTGLLTVDPLAPAQKIKVQVSSASESKSVEVTIKTSVIFEVDNIGINEEGSKIVKLYVNKNFIYNDSVVFIVAVYGENGSLKGVTTREMYGDGLMLGMNELTFDYNLPADFNSDTDEVSVMIWTSF